MSPKKQIVLLGSTGSIGVQTIEVIISHPELFELVAISGNKNIDLLIKQARLLKPSYVFLSDINQYNKVKISLNNSNSKVVTGEDALEEIMQNRNVDLMVTAIVGFAGLQPVIKAIEAGKHIALANKETLVVAGKLITGLAKKHNVNIYPIDSEHSAIFQCLMGEDPATIEKIYLTASGGPFKGKDSQFLQNVTIDQALNHPNWNMGKKITIDSATLMNKGLEVIEAKYLFNLHPDQIDVIIHPQSIIHSMVQFVDGSIKAQMGLPDMRLPILYALGFPQRIKSSFMRFDFRNYPSLTFEPADTKTFKCLPLAFTALKKGGNTPCILNAANEIAVESFLNKEICFTEIPEIIEACLNKINYIKSPDYFELVQTDNITRNVAKQFIKESV